ncbi:hypothetical protein QQF64_017718 [Cirrhinus molitorella]|uniref:Uncharacterized protein n=1 Tax=Cirrhinus molitorella TaxID=172907 RepID=A0ABR3LJG0_9TELE
MTAHYLRNNPIHPGLNVRVLLTLSFVSAVGDTCRQRSDHNTALRLVHSGAVSIVTGLSARDGVLAPDRSLSRSKQIPAFSGICRPLDKCPARHPADTKTLCPAGSATASPVLRFVQTWCGRSLHCELKSLLPGPLSALAYQDRIDGGRRCVYERLGVEISPLCHSRSRCFGAGLNNE